MKKTIVNQNTLALAHRRMMSAYKESYLLLQRYLTKCLDWATGEEEKKELKGKIKEIGQTFKDTLCQEKH